MTREEAIEILQEEHDWVQEPCYVIKAIEIAISALTPPTQEQMERVWPGCSFCKNNGVQDYRTAVCVTRWGMSYSKGTEIESDDIFYAKNHFCRFCGRPLTLEAWKELRKRWEALYASIE